MRRLIVAAVLVWAAAAAGVPGASAAPRKGDCGPRAAHTIVRNRLVRVYRTAKGNYYACARRTGKRTYVEAGHLHLRGRYVSYVSKECYQGYCSFQLYVTDVLAGEDRAVSDDTPGYVLKTVATRYGEAAVLAGAQDRHERVLLKLDWMGTSELDRGPDLGDLTVRDRRLHWRSGTARRDAAAAHGRRCGPSRGTHARALGDRVRVYSVYRSYAIDEFNDYYACLRPGGKPLKLVREDTDPSDHAAGEVDEIVVADRFVGFTEGNCYAGCQSTVTVTDVRARRGVRSNSVDGVVDDLLLSPDAVAAAFVTDSPYPAEAVAVIGFDSRGTTEFDRGSANDFHDLTLDGTTLSWFNGSERRTAELVP
jgi:hypothetical protein